MGKHAFPEGEFPTDGHIAVVGLGFGDEGKGTIVDWLCTTRDITAVVRFNGGAQAAHNVVLADGRHHTFSQWGSGTMRGVPTFLSEHVIVDPVGLLNERKHLLKLGVPEPFDLLKINSEALVVTPYHAAVNKAREIIRGEHRHGSVGMGIGATVEYSLEHPDALKMYQLGSERLTRAGIKNLIDWSRDILQRLGVVIPIPTLDEYDQVLFRLNNLVNTYCSDSLEKVMRSGSVVFEGAQGVLLDEWYGFYPYVTRSRTTFANIRYLTDADVYRLGVVRAYTTRHGAGPLPTELPNFKALDEKHNETSEWQGSFRVGHFDAVLHRYASKVCGRVDGIALTHMDVVESRPDLGIVNSYEDVANLKAPVWSSIAHREKFTKTVLGMKPSEATPVYDWPIKVSEVLQIPVVVTSHGPTAEDKALF